MPWGNGNLGQDCIVELPGDEINGRCKVFAFLRFEMLSGVFELLATGTSGGRCSWSFGGEARQLRDRNVGARFGVPRTQSQTDRYCCAIRGLWQNGMVALGSLWPGTRKIGDRCPVVPFAVEVAGASTSVRPPSRWQKLPSAIRRHCRREQSIFSSALTLKRQSENNAHLLLLGQAERSGCTVSLDHRPYTVVGSCIGFSQCNACVLLPLSLLRHGREARGPGRCCGVHPNGSGSSILTPGSRASCRRSARFHGFTRVL